MAEINKKRLWFKFIGRFHWRLPGFFKGSAAYWEQRYLHGGSSGAGSYGKFAKFKANVINVFVLEHNVTSIIEFGCGDGHQLKLAEYPNYLGFDVNEVTIALCREKFVSDKTKRFELMKNYKGETADLALSLDVIYHLIEDDVFFDYMMKLFNASNKYVIVYSSNSAKNRWYESAHVKHRAFTSWVSANQPGWKMIGYRDGISPSSVNFYIFQKS